MVIQTEVMTVPELAFYLKIARVTVYRLLKKYPDIPRFKIGSDWRFNRSQIDQWMLNKIEQRENDTRKLRDPAER